MSLENEVKEAFKKHSDDARPAVESWHAVETKVRRAHKQRLVYSSALSIMVVAAIAIVLARSPGGNESKGFTNPSATPTESSTPSPGVGPSTTPTAKPPAPSSTIPDGFKARAGVQSGFAVDIPKDWKGGWFEGYWDFEPKGLPSTAQGGDTFALVVTVEPGNYRDATGGVHSTQTTIGGRNALMWSTDALHLSYAVEWPGCPNYEPSCLSSTSPQRLIIRLYGSTHGLWDSYQALGRRAAATVHVYDGTEPEHGTFNAGVKIDDYSKALVRFMDARVEGIGADELMCCNAVTFYSRDGGLYEQGIEATIRYIVDAGTVNLSAAETTYSVAVTYKDGSKRIERISVGYESGKVRSGEVPKILSVCTGCH
jgi:hypothetical protein